MEPIGMDEMQRLFEVVDDLGISREAVQVPLLPEGGGAVRRLESGRLEIVYPAERRFEDFAPELRRRLEELAEPSDLAEEETA